MSTSAEDLCNLLLPEQKSRTISDIIVDSMVASACWMISEVCAKVDTMTPEERKSFGIGSKERQITQH
ncbi:hypothetical protein AD930_06790 [Acetobacter malorum]|nr:hypothetical protein AD930_06790 [Acetobacter malorum]